MSKVRAARMALVSFSLILVASAPVGAQTVDADQQFEKGVRLHQAGDLLGAAEAYQAALALAPRRVDALSNLGAVYVRLGRFDEAIAQYQAALKAEPENGRVLFNLALAHYKTAQLREAAGVLLRVITLAPGNHDARLLLADCKLQMGQAAEVVALLSPYQAELRESLLFAYLFGTALILQNDLARGQAFIDRLMRDRNSAEAHLLLGAAYFARGDHRSALPELERAAELNPKLPTLRSWLGRTLMNLRRRDDAARAFRQELADNPDDFDANLHLGLFAHEDNQLDEALAYLKRAGRLRPEDPSVLYGLGRVHVAAERYEEARTALESLAGQAPDYAPGHVLLAKVYYRLGQLAAAERERQIVEKLRVDQQKHDQTSPATRGAGSAPPAEGAATAHPLP